MPEDDFKPPQEEPSSVITVSKKDFGEMWSGNIFHDLWRMKPTRDVPFSFSCPRDELQDVATR